VRQDLSVYVPRRDVLRLEEVQKMIDFNRVHVKCLVNLRALEQVCNVRKPLRMCGDQA
jgi:hypothetical protein